MPSTKSCSCLSRVIHASNYISKQFCNTFIDILIGIISQYAENRAWRGFSFSSCFIRNSILSIIITCCSTPEISVARLGRTLLSGVGHRALMSSQHVLGLLWLGLLNKDQLYVCEMTTYFCARLHLWRQIPCHQRVGLCLAALRAGRSPGVIPACTSDMCEHWNRMGRVSGKRLQCKL